MAGPYSYPDFLNAIVDPTNPEHYQMLEWNRCPFDLTVPDHEAINQRLLDIKL
jgi:hypothetical protein